MEQQENETRGQFLIRVAVSYISQNPEHTLIYDEAKCDGYCLADELRIEFDLGD